MSRGDSNTVSVSMCKCYSRRHINTQTDKHAGISMSTKHREGGGGERAGGWVRESSCDSLSDSGPDSKNNI